MPFNLRKLKSVFLKKCGEIFEEQRADSIGIVADLHIADGYHITECFKVLLYYYKLIQLKIFTKIIYFII